MKKYYYKDKTEVKAGDIVFYSEYDGKNEDFRYADSIEVIIKQGSGLYFSPRIGTMDNSKTFYICDNPEAADNAVHIRFDTEHVFDDTGDILGKGSTLQRSTRIGHIDTDSHLINPEYAKQLSDRFYKESKKAAAIDE